MRPRSALLTLAFVVVAAAACGGGSDPAPSATDSVAPSSSPSDTGDGSDDAAAFADLAGKVLAQDFAVTYGFTSTNDGGTQSTMTVSWQAMKKRWRLDYNIGGAGDATMIADGPNSVFCQGGDAGICYVMGSPASVGAPIPFFTTALADPDHFADSLTSRFGGNVETTARTIAGIDATCFSGSDDVDDGEVCLSEDGLLLSVNGDGISLEATDAGGTVSDDVFDPPYKVIDIGDLPSLPGE